MAVTAIFGLEGGTNLAFHGKGTRSFTLIWFHPKTQKQSNLCSLVEVE